MVIKYHKQEIIFNGEIKDAEEIAKIYLKSCGYRTVFKTSRMKDYPQFGEIIKNYNEIMNDFSGRPDLVAINGKVIHVYEVKRIYGDNFEDGLRKNQFEWSERHSDIDYNVLFIKVDEEEKSKKYRKIGEQNKKLKYILNNFDYDFITNFEKVFNKSIEGIPREIYMKLKEKIIQEIEELENGVSN